MDDIIKTYPMNEHYDKKDIVFVVAGHCASEILIVRIIRELYAQVSFFPTMGSDSLASPGPASCLHFFIMTSLGRHNKKMEARSGSRRRRTRVLRQSDIAIIITPSSQWRI